MEFFQPVSIIQGPTTKIQVKIVSQQEYKLIRRQKTFFFDWWKKVFTEMDDQSVKVVE